MTKDDQITDLQAANTRLVLENRALKAEVRALREAKEWCDTRRADVTAFFAMAGQEIGASPHVPPESHPHGVRFRLGLILEEVGELFSACFATSLSGDAYGAAILIDRSTGNLQYLIRHGTIAVDLPKATDALADIDYTVEGARVAWGIDGYPIWREVHRSNMAKLGGPVVDGKLKKPEGWTPPDIEGLLRAQGWTNG